jgi:3-hydroxybenzoate 6-monooxygenase
MTMNHPRSDVIVVGGGIGGLANALALTQAGLQVRLLEQAPEFGEVGAGLQIAPNCTRILQQWGLYDEAASLGVLPKRLVMRDAVDACVLTTLDLDDAHRRYGAPYLVIHRSDLHGTLLRACQRAGVDLVNNAHVTGYENVPGGAVVTHNGGREKAPLVIAADGIHSVARRLISKDEPVSSYYVAYRGTGPVHDLADPVSLDDVVVFIGPRCHFVQYALRGGQMLNQVAVFQSPKALRGEEDWGTPDELDDGFTGMCDAIQDGLPRMWRDRWWRMFDREPIASWVAGRIALTGDAAHPPLQYLAQGAVMAIEDAWVLATHAAQQLEAGSLDWDSVLTAYNAVRPEHCRRVLSTARKWGDLWHLDEPERTLRNDILRARDVHDYTYVDWLYGPTALTPDQEPSMFPGRTLNESNEQGGAAREFFTSPRTVPLKANR